MKIIASLSGAAAVRIAVEDVIPKHRVPVQDLVNEITQRYDFMTLSDVNTGGPVVFNNGKLVSEDKTVAITQLQLMQGGYVLFAADTGLASTALSEMMDHMSKRFDYDFNGNIKKRLFLSSVVVEFDGTKSNVLSSMYLLEQRINQTLNGERFVKRLAFGLPDADPGVQLPQNQLSPLDTLEKADFVIERRIGFGPEDNRFFCAAPMETTAHFKLLQEIEDIS